MAKKLGLAAKLKATAPSIRRGSAAWYELLEPDVLEELNQLREEFHAGEFKHSKTEVYAFCKEELKLHVKRQAFVRWLDEKPNG